MEQSGFFHNWEVVSNKSCVGSFVCSVQRLLPEAQHNHTWWGLSSRSDQAMRRRYDLYPTYAVEMVRDFVRTSLQKKEFSLFHHLQEQNLQPCSPTPQPLLPRRPLRVPYVTCHRNISLIFVIHIKTSAWLSWACHGVCGMRNTSRF